MLVIGANGQIGRLLTECLNNSEEYTVRAMVRKKEQLSAFTEKGIEAVIGDLEGTVDNLAKAATGCNAIVFTAGSGGHTGSDKTLLIDLDGAVKTMEAAEKAKVERFIMVSALQAHNREKWNEQIKPYYVAKHYADRILTQSSLNYTIIRPGGLLNEDGTGLISAGENLKRSTIPREDVAKTILAALKEEKTYRCAFDLVSGDQTIHDALRHL